MCHVSLAVLVRTLIHVLCSAPLPGDTLIITLGTYVLCGTATCVVKWHALLLQQIVNCGDRHGGRR
jgi:hypothetical protein